MLAWNLCFPIMHRQILTRECGLLQWAAVLWNTGRREKEHLSLSTTLERRHSTIPYFRNRSFYLECKVRWIKMKRGLGSNLLLFIFLFPPHGTENVFLKIIFFICLIKSIADSFRYIIICSLYLSASPTDPFLPLVFSPLQPWQLPISILCCHAFLMLPCLWTFCCCSLRMLVHEVLPWKTPSTPLRSSANEPFPS